MPITVFCMCALGAGVRPAAAQLESGGNSLSGSRTLLLAVDADDDDEDGVVDGKQTVGIPSDDLINAVVHSDKGDAQLSVLGGLRLIRAGRALEIPLAIPASKQPTQIALQAIRPSSSSQPVALVFSQNGKTVRIPIQAVDLSVLDSNNRPVDGAREALGVSQRVTNDDSLPRVADYEATSPDPSNVRVQILDSTAPGKRLKARLQSLSSDGTRVRDSVALTLMRSQPGMPFRSRFVRLVGDDVDSNAHGVAGQVLRVALRDRIRIVYETRSGRARQGLRVSRPGDEDGPAAARQASLRVTVLRTALGGRPVIGVDDLSALRIVREELEIANEIWLQCHLTLGPAAETSVQIVDAPGATLLAIADGDGLPARGGSVRLRIDGRTLGPLEIPRGSTPQDTALRIEQRIRSAGYQTAVTVNPPAVFGTGPSADIMVRRGDGEFVAIDAVPGVPLTTDPQQRLSIGSVDLSDGLQEFDNMTAQGGTLEERTLIKALADDDPATIDLFIVNRFTRGTRQGEAFIAASSGPIVNTLVLDRNGLRQRQTAWTLAHELGHVLLNQPLHPDNVGTDAPVLLMDSDNNRGTVNGPKRLLPSDCVRMRYEAGKRAVPPLLQPYDRRAGRTVRAASGL